MYYMLTPTHEVIPCDLLTWAKCLETENRVIKKEQVGDFFISTIFTGLDFSPVPHPCLFETAVFDKDDNRDLQERYSTYAEALEGHEATVKIYRNLEKFKKHEELE